MLVFVKVTKSFLPITLKEVIQHHPVDEFGHCCLFIQF